MPHPQSHEVTLDTYKTLSKTDWLPGDENFDSIIINYDEELFYCPEQKQEKPELIEYFNKKKKKWH